MASWRVLLANVYVFLNLSVPHAWPTSYRTAIEDNIVGMKAVGNGLIVTTEGSPYLVAGSDPASMSAIKN